MELTLSGPVGQVYSLVVGNDLLFAGSKVYFTGFYGRTRKNLVFPAKYMFAFRSFHFLKR